jgi:hypothetical protein
MSVPYFRPFMMAAAKSAALAGSRIAVIATPTMMLPAQPIIQVTGSPLLSHTTIAAESTPKLGRWQAICKAANSTGSSTEPG